MNSHIHDTTWQHWAEIVAEAAIGGFILFTVYVWAVLLLV